MENLKYVLEMENITKEFPGVKALDMFNKIKAWNSSCFNGGNGAGNLL